MKLKPLGDRLIVKAVEEDTTTASGIVLPDTARHDVRHDRKGERRAPGTPSAPAVPAAASSNVPT